jgi:hypothetical protein
MKEDVSMKIKVQIAAALAAFALSAGYGYAESSPNLSHAELKKMIQSAHTADQYASLASYFRWRQQELQQQAHAELAEWDRRSQIVSGLTEKYPRPVDSSRNRYEYFTYEAQQMREKAAYYEDLAEKAQR